MHGPNTGVADADVVLLRAKGADPRDPSSAASVDPVPQPHLRDAGLLNKRSDVPIVIVYVLGAARRVKEHLADDDLDVELGLMRINEGVGAKRVRDRPTRTRARESSPAHTS